MQAARLVLSTSLYTLLILGCNPLTDKKVKPAVYKMDDASKFTGTYTGEFGKGIITVVLNYMSDGIVSGYDVHKGLRRNINGEMTRDSGKLSFVLKEPGDNKWDGTFVFALDTATMKIEGEWRGLHEGSADPEIRKLSLARMHWDENGPVDVWGLSDTSLALQSNGTCAFEIYPPGANQPSVFRGNYDWKGDVLRIEWEKNPYLADTMTMTKRDETRLEGGGMIFDR